MHSEEAREEAKVERAAREEVMASAMGEAVGEMEVARVAEAKSQRREQVGGEGVERVEAMAVAAEAAEAVGTEEESLAAADRAVGWMGAATAECEALVKAVDKVAVGRPEAVWTAEWAEGRAAAATDCRRPRRQS